MASGRHTWEPVLADGTYRVYLRLRSISSDAQPFIDRLNEWGIYHLSRHLALPAGRYRADLTMAFAQVAGPRFQAYEPSVPLLGASDTRTVLKKMSQLGIEPFLDGLQWARWVERQCIRLGGILGDGPSAYERLLVWADTVLPVILSTPVVDPTVLIGRQDVRDAALRASSSPARLLEELAFDQQLIREVFAEQTSVAGAAESFCELRLLYTAWQSKRIWPGL